ncbi:helix-turn-helix domain-containing protein [Mycolicibacterium vulneris]|uniref:helix-turn-helix domain-containing protein n=1 Tax=Mycolicibacterium vulneris TaxID=547163 RepID=UPI00267D833E
MARRTGLTKSYLSKIERRCSTTSIAVALKVAKALDVDVGRLFSEEAAQEKITVERATGDAEGEPAADEYEVDAYRRIEVPLRSGATAWVYVFAG